MMKLTFSKLAMLVATTFFLTSQIKAQQIEGCTDPTATNYSAQATFDDGSCCYSNWVLVSSDFPISIQAYSPVNGSYQSYNFPGTFGICLENGCNGLYASSTDGLPFDFTTTVNGNIEVHSGFGNGQYFSLSIGDVVIGCNDPNACNFNPSANCGDTSCDYGCYGCTDANALNYNAAATIDDGSCCTDPSSYYTIQSTAPITVYWNNQINGTYGTLNYPSTNGFCAGQNCFTLNAYSPAGGAFDFQLINPAGEVVYNTSATVLEPYIYVTYSPNASTGCADPNACNFDPAACFSYETCTYDCFGCTDPSAPNFNPNASVDDGSCCTNETFATIVAGNPCNVFISNESQTFSDYLSINTANSAASTCITDGCYFFYAYAADSALGTDITITRGGIVLFSGYVNFNQYYYQFNSNGIDGCADPNACNFNPEATCYDPNVCNYDCQGCTDPSAINYNPNATIDNGLCCFSGLILTSDATVYLSAYSISTYENYNCSTQPGQNNTLCVSDGCYGYYVSTLDGSPANFTLSTADGQVILQANTADPLIMNGIFSYNAIAGCSDINACNYDPNANCLDYGMCDYSCYGCTNPEAQNYDSSATIDDGSCCTASWYTFTASGPCYWNVYANSYYNYYTGGGVYPEQTGFCMTDTSCFSLCVYSTTSETLNFSVTNELGELIYSGTTESFGYAYANISQGQTYGCTDPYACNYDPTAQCQDWNSCDYGCYGCTDPNAPNYEATATTDDGSCCLDSWYTFNCSVPAYFAYNSAFGYGGGGSNGEGFCMNSSCFVFSVYTLSPESASFTITNSNGVIILSATTIDGWFQGSVSSAQEVAGCTDSSACNFNPSATCNDGSCVYYCGGCTDFNAINYNPYAIYDDGTCFFNPVIPEMQLYVQEDELNNQYYLRMQVNNLGNGAPYIMSTNQSGEMMMVDATGSYLTGPYSCDQSVVVSMSSAVYGNVNYMTTNPISAPCSVLSVDDFVETSQWSLYPNPSTGIINVSGLEINNTQITITDMTGRVAMRINKNAQSTQQIDASMLPAGVYQLTIQQEQRTSSKAFVISK